MKYLALLIPLLWYVETNAMNACETASSTVPFECEKEGFCTNAADCLGDDYERSFLPHSPEGLCVSCAFNAHPEYFSGCAFCRRPLIKTADAPHACLDCEHSVACTLISEIKDLYTSHELTKAFHTITTYLENQRTIKKGFIKDFIPHETRKKIFLRTWTGDAHFYKGALTLPNGNKLHVWSKGLHSDDTDKKVVPSHKATAYIEEIFKKYDLFGPETGTPLATLPQGNIVTFEEQIK